MAAPSFFVAMLLALPVAAQQPQLVLRVGVLSSSTLVEDLLATPTLKALLGTSLGTSAKARAAVGPELSVGARVPLRGRTSMNGLLAWQPTTLRAEDAAGTRDVQDMSVLHALLELDFRVREPLVVSGGAGVLGYRSEAVGLFADGADLSPLVRFGAGGNWPVAGQSITVRVVGDMHRFGNALLRSLGGSGGWVVRYGVQLGIVPGGAR